MRPSAAAIAGNDAGPVQCLHLVIPADPVAVRDGLARMFDALILRSLAEDDRGTVEIVLAEVLNNIVEHAYATEAGEIEITLRRVPEGLLCQIVDRGAPMPDRAVPAGTLPAPHVRGPEDDRPPADAPRPRAARPAETPPVDDLPEGGFGWYLIRTLSQDLDYRHADGRNRLTFRLGTVPAAEQSR